MLQIYSTSANGVSTPVNSNIVFNNKAIETGCVATATIPATVVHLNKPGIYMVAFDAVLAKSTVVAAQGELDAFALPAPAGVSGVIMTNNGVEVEQAYSGETSSSATSLIAISFTTLVRVPPSCNCVNNRANLAFKIVGQSSLVFDANVVVTKLA